jgi:hypothetical protein
LTESQEVPASRRVALRALSASPGRPAVRREEDARTSTTTESPAPDVPDVVGVVMGEIAADVQEGLLVIAVDAGL